MAKKATKKKVSKKVKIKKGKKVLRGRKVKTSKGVYELELDEVVSVNEATDKVKLKKSKKTFKKTGKRDSDSEEIFPMPESMQAILKTKEKFKPSKVRFNEAGLKILTDLREGEDDAG